MTGHASLIGECCLQLNDAASRNKVKSEGRRLPKLTLSFCNAYTLCTCTSSHTPVNMHTDIYVHHTHVHIKEKELAQNKTLYYLKYTTNVSAKIKYLHLPKSMNQKNGHFILGMEKITNYHKEWQRTLFLLLIFLHQLKWHCCKWKYF